MTRMTILVDIQVIFVHIRMKTINQIHLYINCFVHMHWLTSKNTNKPITLIKTKNINKKKLKKEYIYIDIYIYI